jgi:hypothetical protein
VPLNFTVLLPLVDPKPLPVMVMEAPTAPDVGERLVILGAATAMAGKKEIANKTKEFRILFREPMTSPPRLTHCLKNQT